MPGRNTDKLSKNVVSVDLLTASDPEQQVSEALRDSGYVLLNNACPVDDFQAFLRSRDWWFKAPAVAGVPGYCKFDFEKKVVQTSLLGDASLRLLLNENILDLIESFVGHEVILSESFTKLDRGVNYVYFPPHTDYAPGYRPSSFFDELRVSKEDMKQPLGLSYVLYHHDTSDGAFCYAEGSHKLQAHRGGLLSDYSTEERAEILKTWTRLDGKAGDLVLFDPRGFHGQDQPTTTSRDATITRFWRTDAFGRRQARPVPVYTMDLEGLSPRQLRALGIGASSLTPLEHDHHAGFRKQRRAYAIATKLIEHSYDLRYLRKRLAPLRSTVKRILGRGSAERR